MKLKQVKDFKSTPYYEYYCKMIDRYGAKIIESTLSTQNNQVLYSWNDVLREVWKFINTEMRELKDSDDLNPTREEAEEEKMKKLLEEQTKQYLGMQG